MQAKISAFFDPQPPAAANQSLFLHQIHHQSLVFSDKNSATTQEPHSWCSNGTVSQPMEEAPKTCNSMGSLNPGSISNKNLNKKRNYAQLHLDLGQSDFLLHTCSICGLRYACGDEGDEKVHRNFHKDYTCGIQFRGWHNERLVHLPSINVGRIILVLDGDPPAHKKKVKKVVEMMEMDLGSGWLIHKLCKVYFYIFHQRIAGCLVSEPIKTAHRVLSNSGSPKGINGTNANKSRSNTSVLRFGGFNFQREVVKRTPSTINPKALEEEDLMGAIILEKEAVPAICGIRAIWVAPSVRRKHIATQLLDAVRISFCEGYMLKSSQLAFSNPTSTGRALACRYVGTSSFLAYKTEM